MFLFQLARVFVFYFSGKIKMTFENRLTLSAITVRFTINNLLGIEKNLRTKCCWCRLNSVTSDLLIKLLLHKTQSKQRRKNVYFSLNTVISVFIYSVY